MTYQVIGGRFSTKVLEIFTMLLQHKKFPCVDRFFFFKSNRIFTTIIHCLKLTNKYVTGFQEFSAIDILRNQFCLKENNTPNASCPVKYQITAFSSSFLWIFYRYKRFELQLTI